MSLSIELEQLHKKHVKLGAKLQSIGKKERTLRGEVKMLKERLAIVEFERKLRERKFPILCGEKAIWAIRDFVNEIEEQRGKELTEKQVDALIKLANGFILSIKTDTSPIRKPLEWHASPQKVRALYSS